MAKIGKRKALIWLVLTLLFLSLALFAGWIIKFYRDYQSLPSEHLIGNKVSNVNKLKEEGFPFSFLVIGDTHGSEMGEALIKKALKHGKYSFMIHLGDFVKEPDIWAHRLFLTEMVKEIKPSFPVFLVPGNHDIDYQNKIIAQKDRMVTQEIFDSLYGTRNYDFVFNNCLFILSEIDWKNPNGYLDYLRKALSKKGEGKKFIFIFIHYPPKGMGASMDFLPNEEQFFSLLEDYRVTTCFFGHYHGYKRGQRKGVNLIIAGGGGGRLKETQSKWGKFHHILKVTVDEHIITESLITLNKKIYFEDSFERWIFTQIFPFLYNKSWLLYGIFPLFLFCEIYSFIFLIISLKRKS